MKIYINTIKESWVIDRFKKEWLEFNNEFSTSTISNADIIWIIAPWTWKKIPKKFLKKKTVVCSIYHIDEKKFTPREKKEFQKRDEYVNKYHVISNRTKEQVERLTNKEITVIPFWINQDIWFEIDKSQIRNKYSFPEDRFLIGSFQRDTEGSDLFSPKLSKGPDIFINIISKMYKQNSNIEIILTGKRRNYIISELEKIGVNYHYFEMVDFSVLNELYNCLDLYIVSSRYEGGPQSILECGITKTPIISTKVGIADEILSPKSIYDVDNFFQAKPDIETAYENSLKYVIPKGFKDYHNLFKDVYED